MPHEITTKGVKSELTGVSFATTSLRIHFMKLRALRENS
jgi:hypothetical protein